MKKQELIKTLKEIITTLEQSEKEEVAVLFYNGFDNFACKKIVLNEYDTGFDLEIQPEKGIYKEL